MNKNTRMMEGDAKDCERMVDALNAGRPVCTTTETLSKADALAERLKRNNYLILYTKNGTPEDWTDYPLLRRYCLDRKGMIDVKELARLPEEYYPTTAMVCRFLVEDEGKQVGTIYAYAPVDFDRDLYMLSKRLQSLSFALYSGYMKGGYPIDCLRMIDQLNDTSEMVSELRDQLCGMVDATADDDNE